MTKKEIQTFRSRIEGFINRRRLRDAILEMKTLSQQRRAMEVYDKIKQIEDNYSYMLRYLTDGAIDPQRDEVYESFLADLYTVLDSLTSHLESAEVSSLYYDELRVNRLRPSYDRLSMLISDYRRLDDKLSIFSMVTSGTDNSDAAADRKSLETRQSEIFKYLWTTPILSNDDKSRISELLADPGISSGFKQQIVSGLMLGLLEQYDRSKLELLITTYLSSENINVSSAALVGMLFGLWKYRSRPLTRKVTDLLMAAKDTESWSSDLRIAFIEMIRAHDTERINRKMQDEVMPRMTKIRPDIIEKMNKTNINPLDAEAMQENPEWQELLDKSGITDQLKELMELQMEGGDVMMSTFSHLKTFPFFSDISNWFLPFDRNHTSVADTMNELEVVGDMMENARFLCDSDKYSFIMLLHSVPASQKGPMLSQMKSQSDAIYESMSGHTAPDDRRMAVNSYMQNIYRFYKLFRRKDEFFDPFDSGINLIAVEALADDFDDTEMLQVVAEFYFKLHYMKEALDVYSHIEKLEGGDAQRYQKMGYCYECQHNYDMAIELYKKAELLNGESVWLSKRLASCYRMLGKNAEALEYYRLVAQSLPEDMSAAMLYGQSLLENGEISDALHEFYKVEYLDEKSTKAWRPLAWTLLISGDAKGALEYYNKILDDAPTANDYLNMGHTSLALGDIKGAVEHYVQAIRAHESDTEWYVDALATDEPWLQKAGIDTSILPLIADATLYRL